MVQCFCFDILQAGGEDFSRLYTAASPERQARADRCIRREDALRSLAAEALLRCALHRSLPGQPLSVRKDAFGKPYLENCPDFHFNLSHSGRWAVIAWGSSPLGIDVEQLRSEETAAKIARRCFTPGEQAWLFEADGPQRSARFCRLWTAKESYLKYLGTGLRTPLNSFDVLEMKSPAFHSFPLEDGSYLTICTSEAVAPPQFLTPEALLI